LLFLSSAYIGAAAAFSLARVHQQQQQQFANLSAKIAACSQSPRQLSIPLVNCNDATSRIIIIGIRDVLSISQAVMM